MITRALRGCLLLLLLTVANAAIAAAPVAKDGELTIVRVYSTWREGSSFKRIAEYFDGQEHTGREVVRRTHPEERSGYYFLVRVKNPGPAQPVRFQLQLIEEGRAAPRTTVFPAELGTGSTVFQLGLTGPAWQDAKKQPMAWHLEIVADDGRVLATEQSYLWEKPAK